MSDLEKRLADPPEGCMTVRAIEASFEIPVHLSSTDKSWLHRTIQGIISQPYNQPAEGVHWLAGMGSKPHFNQADAAFLNKPIDPKDPLTGDPIFDDSVMFYDTCAREFVSDKERDQVNKERRGKFVEMPQGSRGLLGPEDIKRLTDQADLLCDGTGPGDDEFWDYPPFWVEEVPDHDDPDGPCQCLVMTGGDDSTTVCIVPPFDRQTQKGLAEAFATSGQSIYRLLEENRILRESIGQDIIQDYMRIKTENSMLREAFGRVEHHGQALIRRIMDVAKFDLWRAKEDEQKAEKSKS